MTTLTPTEAFPPCPNCGVDALRIELRFTAVDRFSLAGATPKVSANEWPWLVCDNCKISAKAQVDG